MSAPLALPRPLEPWRPWLALLGPDLAVPLGQLLLQLDPLVGHMRAAAPSPDAISAGVGSIVQRGAYERLLISEWAVADAAPDEFIRRAASNELLFTGPEPERQRRSLRTIALFDAGPAQLGEPRLAQLALFILLARRAQDAGAAFAWGVLQHPGELHQDSGQRAVRALLNARTLLCMEADDIDAWERALDLHTDQEVWQVGADATPLLRQAQSHVAITPSLLDDRLDLVVRQHTAVRRVTLDLPPAPVGVRLLRHPFGAAEATQTRSCIGTSTQLRPSALQLPRFGAGSAYLAAGRMGGGILIYQVPSSSAAAPAAPRTQSHAGQGSLLGVAMLKRNCGTVSSHDGKIYFAGFPGLLFSKGWVAARPPIEQFLAPPGSGRWLPTFFLAQNASADTVKRILMRDLKQRLVCWEWSAGPTPTLHFSVVATSVIGVAQLGNILVYACVDALTLDIQLYRWDAREPLPSIVDVIGVGASKRACFGGKDWGKGGFHGTMAWEGDDGRWELTVAERRGAITVDLPEGAGVIGIATVSAETDGAAVRTGLLVLARDKLSIRLCTGTDNMLVARSATPIAQAALDATGERLVWIVDSSRELCVRNLRTGQLLLRVVSEGDADAA